MSINIRKRSGVLEPLDVNMIRKKIKKAFKYIKENSLVNIEDYLMSIRNYLKDGTSSVEISNMLIKSGLDNIQPGSFEFDSIVANLLVQDIEHRVYKETKLLTYNSYIINKENGHSSESLEDYLGETYKDYIKYGIDEEIIHPIFSTVYGDYGLKKLGTFIDPERDYLFKYIGIKTLEDRYLKRNKKGDIFELPQWRFMTAAGFLAISNKFILSYIDSYNDKEEHIGYELSYYSLFILDNLFHHPVNYNGVFSKEDIESLIDNISAHLRSEYEDIDKEVRILFASAFYDCISSFDLMTATPTLNNAGTIHHQLSSCFQLDTPDNIEGHLHGEMEKALYSKYGGGLGGYLGRYRGGGLPVDTALDAGQSVVSWLKISNDVVTTVNQLGCVAKNSYVKKLSKLEIDGISYNPNDIIEIDGITGKAIEVAYKLIELNKSNETNDKVPCAICGEKYSKLSTHIHRSHKNDINGFNYKGNYNVTNMESVELNTRRSEFTKSPYSIDRYVKEGYSREEAIDIVNINTKNSNLGFSPNTINYWIKKGFSEDEAKEKVSNYNSDRLSIEYLNTRFGNELGNTIYNNKIDAIKYSQSKQRFMDEYGENWEVEYNKFIINTKSRSLDSYQLRLGEVEGLEAYYKFLESKNQYKSSAAADNLFQLLHSDFPDLISLITSGREYSVRVSEDEAPKLESYLLLVDAYIPSINTIIEFNGDYWHGNPTIYNDDDIIRSRGRYRKAKDVQDYDKLKVKYLESLGYNVITIWESDNISDKIKLLKGVEKCIK